MKEIDLIQYIKGPAGNRNVQRTEWAPVLKRLDAGKIDPAQISSASELLNQALLLANNEKVSSSWLVAKCKELATADATPPGYFNTNMRATLIKLWRDGKIKLFLLNDDTRQVRWGLV